jgi:hypothetical protein
MLPLAVRYGTRVSNQCRMSHHNRSINFAKQNHGDCDGTAFVIRNHPFRAGLTTVDERWRRSMRAILTAAVATAALAVVSSNAFAQGDYMHHNFCLRTGSTQECAYETFGQCEAAKHSNVDTCEPNGPPINH